MSKQETVSKKELLQTIEKQKEQISRYETRFRDVVIAYKGLIKEKEALEASFKALNKSNVSTSRSLLPVKQEIANEDGQKSNAVTNELLEEAKQLLHPNEKKNKGEETVEQLRTQLTTLMNSLATLSAEKSRMEASFQADKKQIRQEKEEREKNMKEIQDRLQQVNKQHHVELESMKSKVIMERHERDKEQSDHGVMIRELQKLLAEERRQKEQMESISEELRSRLVQTDSHSGQREHFEKRLRDVRNELEATRRKLKRAEAKAKETPPLLLELQEEMSGMKMQHQAAIREEQKRAADAEERARRLAAMHEERVANLEGRLAELSETVGSYDRLRQQDQMAIMKLKEHIAQLDLEQMALARVAPKLSLPDLDPEQELKGKSEADLSSDLQSLVEQILGLKRQLLLANQRAEKPIDVHAVLSAGDCYPSESSDVHQACQEELSQIQKEFELYKKQQQPNNLKNDNADSEVADLKSQVQNLKERVRILNVQLDDTENECKQKVDQLQAVLRSERASVKNELAASENDFRCRLAILEQQLQKQRERSLALLEDKEQEIRTIKSTFQAFLPGSKSKDASSGAKEAATAGISDDVLRNLSQFSLGPVGGGESPHMLHYAHELARRDVEISNLHKAKHRLESALRELQRAATNGEERHQERVQRLKEEVARLERCKSREGANLEYLKNVVLSFLLSDDSNSKRHMLNAISAVLKFSMAELDRVNKTHRAVVQPTPL